MIQRIQSIYLIIAAIISGGLIFAFPLWTFTGGNEQGISTEPIAMVLFFLSAILSIYSITRYKTRQTQFVLGRLNMLVNLVLVIYLVYRLMNPAQGLTDGVEIERQGIVTAFPLVVIILIALANRAIKKDEDLVRSADRLR